MAKNKHPFQFDATCKGYAGRTRDIYMAHQEPEPAMAALCEHSQRDYRSIDTIDGRVYDETLDCWVYAVIPQPDLSILATKFKRK